MREVLGVWRDSKLVIVAYKPKYMTYFWQHSSAQPTCAGARRHAGGASARFRQDIKARVGAYERWECPLCVAKFWIWIVSFRIFGYVSFISVKIRKTYLKIWIRISRFHRLKRMLPAFICTKPRPCILPKTRASSPGVPV